MENPQTKVQFPRLIYGTAQRTKKSPIPPSVALSCGYRAVDIAGNDAHDEDVLGKDLQAYFSNNGNVTARESVMIQAKYSPIQLFKNKSPPYSREDAVALQVLKSFQSTLSKLGVSYVDVLFLHRPLPSRSQTYAAWEVMEEIVRRGGARSLGISQVDGQTLAALWGKADIRPRVVQNPCITANGYDSDIRQWCRRHGVAYQAFGLLQDRSRLVLEHDAVQELAGRDAISAEAALVALALQCATDNGEDFGVVIGSTAAAHVKEHKEVAEATEVAGLRSVDSFRALFCAG